MTYWSQAWQDEFVANILNFKRDGHYLDIGSCDAKGQSNSYFFESELNWKGICIEIAPQYIDSYKIRNCTFLNEDAILIDYKSLLKEKSFPLMLDYLSLDVDDSSLNTLKQLPLDNYRFRVITIEHDAYRGGDALKYEQRSILEKFDYFRLFSDVLVPLGCGMGPNLSFEDWWINQDSFNMNKMNALSATNMYPDNIVAMIKNKADTYLI
jgi:hypothetical protein